MMAGQSAFVRDFTLRSVGGQPSDREWGVRDFTLRSVGGQPSDREWGLGRDPFWPGVESPRWRWVHLKGPVADDFAWFGSMFMGGDVYILQCHGCLCSPAAAIAASPIRGERYPPASQYRHTLAAWCHKFDTILLFSLSSSTDQGPLGTPVAWPDSTVVVATGEGQSLECLQPCFVQESDDPVLYLSTIRAWERDDTVGALHFHSHALTCNSCLAEAQLVSCDHCRQPGQLIQVGHGEVTSIAYCPVCRAALLCAGSTFAIMAVPLLGVCVMCPALVEDVFRTKEDLDVAAVSCTMCCPAPDVTAVGRVFNVSCCATLPDHAASLCKAALFSSNLIDDITVPQRRQAFSHASLTTVPCSTGPQSTSPVDVLSSRHGLMCRKLGDAVVPLPWCAASSAGAFVCHACAPWPTSCKGPVQTYQCQGVLSVRCSQQTHTYMKLDDVVCHAALVCAGSCINAAVNLQFPVRPTGLWPTDAQQIWCNGLPCERMLWVS